MTGAAIVFLLVVAYGCTESTPEFRGIQTRIYVDRTGIGIDPTGRR